ncbi:hypothetical protein D3C78_915110 [compost metagenome]
MGGSRDIDRLVAKIPSTFGRHHHCSDDGIVFQAEVVAAQRIGQQRRCEVLLAGQRLVKARRVAIHTVQTRRGNDLVEVIASGAIKVHVAARQ